MYFHNTVLAIVYLSPVPDNNSLKNRDFKKMPGRPFFRCNWQGEYLHVLDDAVPSTIMS